MNQHLNTIIVSQRTQCLSGEGYLPLGVTNLVLRVKNKKEGLAMLSPLIVDNLEYLINE